MKSEEILLTEALEKVNIRFSTATYERMFEFIKLLLETNQTVNLTSITDYREALIKHIYDSMIINNLNEFENAETILDVGSGAGLPGIPLAIAHPEKKFISMDSVQKKIKFQEQACQVFGINNLTPLWGRAEDLARKSEFRGKFDLILARALAPMNILAELTLPFLKVDGFVLLYKGKDYKSELEQSMTAMNILGGGLTNVIQIDLPEDYGTRNIITLKKIKTTPEKFPRKAGTPQKNPLV